MYGLPAQYLFPFHIRPEQHFHCFQVFRDLTDADFIAAAKAHLRDSRYFPTPSDILGLTAEIRHQEARQRAMSHALPEGQPSPELFEHQAGKARGILDMLGASMGVRQ